MKNLILIVTLCIVSQVSFAKTIHPKIDDDLEFKYESEIPETSQRGVANAKDSEPEMKIIKTDAKKRDVASDEEIFDKVNQSGIQYWKY